MDDSEIEQLGSMDGESDAISRQARYASHGSSVDLDELTDEQRDLYDNAYQSSFDANEAFFDDEESF